MSMCAIGWPVRPGRCLLQPVGVARPEGRVPMKTKVLTAAVLAAFLAAGCQTSGPGQTTGTVGGAVAGGVLGAQFGEGTGQLIATGVGTLLGAWAGSQMGQQFDRQDHTASGHAGQSAFNTGQQQAWQGPNSSGTVTPSGPVFYQNGRECQNFTQTVYVNGQPNQATGVACRASDGSWVVDRYN
jgi:surface antigen